MSIIFTTVNRRFYSSFEHQCFILFKFCFSWFRYNYYRISSFANNRLFIERNSQASKLALNYTFLFQSSYWRPRIVSLLSPRFKVFFLILIMIIFILTQPYYLYYLWFLFDFIWFNLIYWTYFILIIVYNYLTLLYGSFWTTTPTPVLLKNFLKPFNIVFRTQKDHLSTNSVLLNAAYLLNTDAREIRYFPILKKCFQITRHLSQYPTNLYTLYTYPRVSYPLTIGLIDRTYLRLVVIRLQQNLQLTNSNHIFLNISNLSNTQPTYTLSYNLIDFYKNLKLLRWEKAFFSINNSDLFFLNQGVQKINEPSFQNTNLSLTPITTSILFYCKRILATNSYSWHWSTTRPMFLQTDQTPLTVSGTPLVANITIPKSFYTFAKAHFTPINNITTNTTSNFLLKELSDMPFNYQYFNATGSLNLPVTRDYKYFNIFNWSYLPNSSYYNVTHVFLLWLIGV